MNVQHPPAGFNISTVTCDDVCSVQVSVGCALRPDRLLLRLGAVCRAFQSAMTFLAVGSISDGHELAGAATDDAIGAAQEDA
jgi:hypothetical protein